MTLLPNGGDSTMQAWQRLLQEAARKAGLKDPLPRWGADGLGGSETQTAILNFQGSLGLALTGQLDEATRAALNPPHTGPRPTLLESIGMFSNIVHLALSLLPGLPDDIGKIRAIVGELVTDASDKNGIEGLRDAARFARILADEADKVADSLDPSGTIQPTSVIVNK